MEGFLVSSGSRLARGFWISGNHVFRVLVRIHFIPYRLAPVGAVETWESWFRLLRGSADRDRTFKPYFRPDLTGNRPRSLALRESIARSSPAHAQELHQHALTTRPSPAVHIHVFRPHPMLPSVDVATSPAESNANLPAWEDHT